MLGESAVFVKAGSTISLTCEINLYSVPPPDITWYHGTKVILPPPRTLPLVPLGGIHT